MNTKTLLLFALFLLLFPQTISMDASTQKQAQHSSATTMNLNATEKNNHKSADPINWNWNLTDTNSCNDYSSHNSDDDCKSHYFHFSRFARRRSRLLFCFLGKLILLITHLSSVIMIVHNYLIW